MRSRTPGITIGIRLSGQFQRDVPRDSDRIQRPTVVAHDHQCPAVAPQPRLQHLDRCARRGQRGRSCSGLPFGDTVAPPSGALSPVLTGVEKRLRCITLGEVEPDATAGGGHDARAAAALPRPSGDCPVPLPLATLAPHQDARMRTPAKPRRRGSPSRSQLLESHGRSAAGPGRAASRAAKPKLRAASRRNYFILLRRISQIRLGSKLFGQPFSSRRPEVALRLSRSSLAIASGPPVTLGDAATSEVPAGPACAQSLP